MYAGLQPHDLLGGKVTSLLVAYETPYRRACFMAYIGDEVHLFTYVCTIKRALGETGANNAQVELRYHAKPV